MENWEKDLNYVTELIVNKLKDLRDGGITYITKENETLITNKEAKMNKDKSGQLKALKESLIDCKKCSLSECRTNIVFGCGSSDAKLLFVGEAPGAEEDLKGEPFVGRAGKLLEKMIVAMGLKRENVYICNTIKCRPPKNRDPYPNEIATCEPFLQQQIDIIQPQVIVGLGRHACQTLLGVELAMSKLRGVWQEYNGIKFMPTFHPAYLLRNPSAKKDVWEDLQKVMEII